MWIHVTSLCKYQPNAKTFISFDLMLVHTQQRDARDLCNQVYADISMMPKFYLL